MKYAACFFVALLAVKQAQAIPMIDLAPSSNTVGVNETFTVGVFSSGIEAGDPLLAFGFDVASGAGLGYDSAAVAAPFLDDSLSFATTDVAGSTLPAVSGDDILLGTLSLMAGTSPGIWDVSVAASPGDLGASEGLFTVTGLWDIDETITVEVVDVGPVPVPSTLLLLALGLLGAGIRPRT